MAYDVTISSKKDASSSYRGSVDYLLSHGFKVMHKRDFAWLIQVSKEIDGKTRVISVTCRPGAQTSVTISCLTAQAKPDEGEKKLVDALAQELAPVLNA